MADTFDHLLNDAVNLHVQAVDHHRNLAVAEIRQRPIPVANPVNLDSGDQTGSIPTIWPNYGRLARSNQNSRIPAY